METKVQNREESSSATAYAASTANDDDGHAARIRSETNRLGETALLPALVAHDAWRRSRRTSKP